MQYGNITLMPQPARGWGENSEKMYHAKDLAPPHQYVAAYAWLRNGFKADAVVHVGTHGTLEWLDGKDIGLSSDDASDALMADIPDIYIYNVDVVGEGLVARRRGMATLVDHMVPAFKKGGLYAAARRAERSSSPTTRSARTTTRSSPPPMPKECGSSSSTSASPRTSGSRSTSPVRSTKRCSTRPRSTCSALKGQNIPYGLHTFGRTPAKAERDSTVDAIVSVDRSLLPSKAKVFAADMDRASRHPATAELDGVVRALRGGYVVTGGGGEPIRNPDAYPTGQNFYGIDPDKVPKPASWDIGVKLGQQMLAEHVTSTARYPAEGVVRHLGRRDDAPRGRGRIADLLPARHQAGVERARQSGGRRRWCRGRSSIARAWTS